LAATAATAHGHAGGTAIANSPAPACQATLAVTYVGHGAALSLA
jgi:hypothetical protein